MATASPRDCFDVETIDRHLDGELDPVRAQLFREHLGRCVACRDALAACERFRAATRLALGEPVDVTALEERLEARLRTEASGPRVRWPFRAALAASLLAALLAPAWVAGELRLLPGLPALPMRIDTGLYRSAGVMHYYCGIRRRVPEPPTRTVANAKLERYAPLLDEIPFRAAGYELVDAHVCSFRGRGFAHLVLRRSGHVVSVLISRDVAGFLPPLGEVWRAGPDGRSLRRLTRGRFTFEVLRDGPYVGFLASDLEPEEERRLSETFAPGLGRVLEEIALVEPSRDRI